MELLDFFMDVIRKREKMWSKIKYFSIYLLLLMANCTSYEDYKMQCYAEIGCHDAIANCYVTFSAAIKNRDELNSLCILSAASCRKFCARCAASEVRHPYNDNYHPCDTNQYKPFFGLADGHSDN